MTRIIKQLMSIRQRAQQGLVGRLMLILCLGLATVGFIVLTKFFFSARVPVAEYPSPDEKHSILVLEEGPATFMDEFFDEYYAISSPEPNRQTKEFYSRETYTGGNTYNELADVRWVDIEHIAYGTGKKTRFCNIHKLSSLVDCTATPPKRLKEPILKTLEDKLIASAKQGQTQEVQQLLKKGANVHYRTPYQNTALIKAAEGGHLAVVGALIKAKAVLNAENSLHQTALSLAVENNHTPIVKALLDAKAKIQDSYFITAVQKGHVDTVRLLLNAGANPNTNDGNSPIIVDAIVRGNTEIVRMLLNKGADVKVCTDATGHTPLMFATLWGRESIVKMLLERGADPNASDKAGQTALSEAVDGVGRTTREPNQKIIQMLIQAGANIKAQGTTESILAKAAQTGDIKLMQFLLDKGATVNDTNQYGQTPLMAAVSFGHVDAVGFLIGKGANANAVSRFGETALEIAARDREAEICEMLLKAGAEVNGRIGNNNGATPLDLVVRDVVRDIRSRDNTKREATYRVLRKYGAKTRQE